MTPSYAEEALIDSLRRKNAAYRALLERALTGALHEACGDHEDPDPCWHCCDWRELAQDIQAALDGETSPDPLIEENRRLRRLVDHYETGIRRLIEEVSRHDTGAAAGVRGDP